MKSLLRSLKAELFRIDYETTAFKFAVSLARYFVRGFAGSIFVLLLALHIGVALKMPWAAEIDAMSVLDHLYRLQGKAWSDLLSVGAIVGQIFVVIGSLFAWSSSISYRKIAD